MKSLKDVSPADKYTLQPQYTTIFHPVRTELDITVSDYVVMDSIDKLSHRPGHAWCTQSKDQIALFTGISRRTVFRSIDTGLDKNLIEKNEKGDVRTTELWIEKVRLYKTKIGK